MFYQCGQDKGCVCGRRGGYGADSSDVGACDCPLLLSVLEVSSDLSFHVLILFLIGSARRKLTCTICNRKCSSSLNLQEHRKVRLYNIYCSAEIIPNAYSASDLRGFTQLTQFCMIHFYKKKKKEVPFWLFLAVQWDPSHSSCYPAQPLNLAVVSAS